MSVWIHSDAEKIFGWTQNPFLVIILMIPAEYNLRFRSRYLLIPHKHSYSSTMASGLRIRSLCAPYGRQMGIYQWNIRIQHTFSFLHQILNKIWGYRNKIWGSRNKIWGFPETINNCFYKHVFNYNYKYDAMTCHTHSLCWILYVGNAPQNSHEDE